MRIRLFWQLVITFVILIVVGIGGTMALIGVTLNQIVTRNLPTTFLSLQERWTGSLADYYVAHDNSWVGVETRLDSMVSLGDWFPGGTAAYVLRDRDGVIVVQRGRRDHMPSDMLDGVPPGSPIIVDGEEVGRFALVAPGARFGDRQPPWRDDNVRPAPDGASAVRAEERNVGRQVGRAFLGVAIALGSVMLGLAIVVGRTISAPLRRVSAAARRVAGGDLNAQVPGSSIIEVDELARSFNQMTADLRHADQLRRNMTADIAHELRTPLTIIKGKLEGIMDGVYAPNAEHIGPVLEEANLLERLIDDLRVLSLAEAGQLPLFREDVPLSDLLADARAAFAREAAAAQITLAVEATHAGALLHVDPQRMQQVLGNLLGNSLRYTSSGGRVILGGSAHDGTATITVADTGQGIAPDELPAIFDRFYRSDRARSHNGHGAGLGLAIAKQLVEAHGGRISARSTLGEGTTITIELPTTERKAQGG
jgi:signal transduction histidine kinase